MKKLAQLFSAALVICSAALPLHSATNLEVLKTIEDKWNSLPGVDRDADNQELLAFARNIPEFSGSGLDTRCSCVWAIFRDGTLVVLANNGRLQGPPPQATAVTGTRSAHVPLLQASPFPTQLAELPAAAPASPAPTEMPQAGSARLLNARGPDMPDPVPDLRSWLTAQSYSPLSGENASVESLRSLRLFGGDGVFYINAYGAWLNNTPANGNFLLSTSTLVTEATEADPDIQADKAAGQLTYMGHGHFWDPVAGHWIKKTLYAINAAFVRSWQDFSPNSFVYIDACDSDIDTDFKQAFFDKKASVYAGWNDSVGIIPSAPIAKFFIDRLLGTNHVVPEADGFNQRSFDYIQVGVEQPGVPSDATWHGMNDFPAFLQFTANPAQTQRSFGLLAPSISSGSAIELDLFPPLYTAGTLQIGGIFGTDPRPDLDTKVTVGGLDCPVKPGAAGWQPDQILCDLPSGAAGDVVVTVRKHDSNKGRLTKWNGTFNYSIVGDDSLKVSVTYHAVFRADARRFRGVIHNPPIGPFFGNTGLIVDESSATYACSGSAVRTDGDTTTTITWRGGGDLAASRVLPAAPNTFQMALDGLSGPTVTVGIDHGPGPGCDWTSVTVNPGGTSTISDHWDLSKPMFDIGALPIEPNDPSFPAGSKSDFPACNAPPTFLMPQCRMQWDTITAMFAPDHTTAR